jgi:hypothetical protein
MNSVASTIDTRYSNGASRGTALNGSGKRVPLQNVVNGLTCGFR